MAELVHVTGDLDWEGFYVGGHLITEGHRIVADTYSFDKLLRVLGTTLRRVYYDPNWMESEGHLPNILSKVKAQG